MGVSFDDLPDVVKPKSVTFDDIPDAYDRSKAGIGERINKAGERRFGQIQGIANQAAQGQIGDAEAMGRIGLKTAVIVPDIASELATSAFRSLPDIIETPIRKAGSNVYSAVARLPSMGGGSIGERIPQEVQTFQENNPVAAGRIESILDAGNLVAGFIPVKGTSAYSATGMAGEKALGVAGNVAKGTVTVPAKAALNLTTTAAKGVNKGLEGVGQFASEQVVKSNLPQNLKTLPKAEALFLRTLQNEGVSLDDAINTLRPSKALGVSPSVASSAELPSMKEMGFLMGRGSQGSKVAAQAVKDIEINQIPKLNTEIIKKATGGNALSAEQYGANVSKIAKESIDAQKRKLATRAKPYYQASVGVDKSVNIQNPLMQKALGNPLAVKALNDWRTDPYTLTNVQKELGDFGIDASQLDKLPYNSTVTLHAARTHLRQLNDAAFRAGEKQKGVAIKQALNDIDDAIISEFPAYKTGKMFYSEDAGALRALNESPMGQMANVGEGNLSKISNDLMTKDPTYINKFFSRVGRSGADENKMREAVAGAYLKRKLEDATKEGVRFSDSVLKNETTRNQLKTLIGDEKFGKLQEINKVIDELNDTRGMMSGARTSAVQSIRDETTNAMIPTNRGELLMSLKAKYTPSLIDMVKNNPESAARFNELLFTDEGFKLLDSMSNGKKLTVGDQNRISKFFTRAKKEVK